MTLDNVSSAAGAKEGSLAGSILMISGCCIGAGMVGLPAATAFCGFFPSIFALLFSWAFMVVTGFLLLEVNLKFEKGANLLQMSEQTLGPVGKRLCGVLFVFLFFSLMIAYLGGTSGYVVEPLSRVLGKQVPNSVGILLSGIPLIYILHKGIRGIDRLNRIFIVGMVVTYCILVFWGAGKANGTLLSRASFNEQILFSIPVMLISFGYQNLLPSITTYLGKEKRRIQIAILVGCSIPLLVYVIWEAILLGTLNPEAVPQFVNSGGRLTRDLFPASIGLSHFFLFIELFSIFAMLTSLLAVALSFVDFLADHFKSKSIECRRLWICMLVVIPPAVVALICPSIFLKGLGLAGGFGAVVLFGLLPVMMCWSLRYGKSAFPEEIQKRGGKFPLVVVGVLSVAIVLIEVWHQLQNF